jgi:hypothetical protein
MHNTYVDRGIIKWAPFDALVGYHEIIERMKHRNGKKERPVLSEDQYEQLNRRLKMALHYALEVEISYYKDGYINHTFGQIKKVDWHRRQLLLSTYEKISADDLIEMIIFDETTYVEN